MRLPPARAAGGAGYESYVGHLAWQVMAESGHFPAHVPATLRGAKRAPAMTPAELVDRHNVTDPDIHALFVAYLTRRSHDIDYSTLRDIAADLCGKFWTGVRKVNPAQADLALAPEDYESWRAVLEIRGDGQPRLSADAVLTTIRAFYVDIQGWAAQEPERWARWVSLPHWQEGNQVTGENETPRQGTHGWPNTPASTAPSCFRGRCDRPPGPPA